jgi:hypothetical protein
VLPNVLKVTGAREILAELVKRNCHYAIGGVKSFFHTVAMMNIDIDIQHALMDFKKLENGEHDVVNVTKPGRFVLLCVVQSTSPINDRVSLLVIQTHRPSYAPTGVDLAKVEQSIEHGAILRTVESFQLPHVFVLVVRGYQP